MSVRERGGEEGRLVGQGGEKGGERGDAEGNEAGMGRDKIGRAHV